MISTFLPVLAQAAEGGLGDWFTSGLSILAVAIFFGFCIFIHELGHFLAAKWRGLHIVAFSIGFRKAWGIKYKGVEYRIGWLPFGGYVDLPQVDSSDEQPTDENGTPLPRVSPMDRIIVALAGPTFNILSGLLIAIPIWIHGLETLTPVMDHIVVRDVNQTSPEYKAGLRDGDAIVAVNGKPFLGTWENFAEKVVYHTGSMALTVQRAGVSDTVITYVPAANLERSPEGIAYPFFNPIIPATVVPVPGSPAEHAGILSGDIILAMDVNGTGRQDVTERSQVVSRLSLADNAGDSVKCLVWVRREGKALDTPIVVNAVRQPVSYECGVDFSYQQYPQVVASSDTSLLMPGDIVLAINGTPARDYMGFREQLTQDSGATPLVLSVVRNNKRVTVPMIACNNAGTVAGRYTFDLYDGVSIRRVAPNSEAARQGVTVGALVANDSFLQALYAGVAPGSTIGLSFLPPNSDMMSHAVLPFYSQYQMGVWMRWMKHPDPFTQFGETITSTGKMLYGIFNKNSTISVKHMSGPINIVNVVHKVSKRSFWGAVSLIVMISFSLGLLNLFPIPILDGGHIVLGFLQIITRRPIPAKVLRPIMTLFFFLLIALMLYVTFNDVVRVGQDIMPATDEFSASLAPLPADG